MWCVAGLCAQKGDRQFICYLITFRMWVFTEVNGLIDRADIKMDAIYLWRPTTCRGLGGWSRGGFVQLCATEYSFFREDYNPKMHQLYSSAGNGSYWPLDDWCFQMHRFWYFVTRCSPAMPWRPSPSLSGLELPICQQGSLDCTGVLSRVNLRRYSDPFPRRKSTCGIWNISGHRTRWHGFLVHLRERSRRSISPFDRPEWSLLKGSIRSSLVPRKILRRGVPFFKSASERQYQGNDRGWSGRMEARRQG